MARVKPSMSRVEAAFILQITNTPLIFVHEEASPWSVINKTKFSFICLRWRAPPFSVWPSPSEGRTYQQLIFVCLLSPSFSLPSCAGTEDVHRRPRVRATQPHLQKGCSIFHFLPDCTVIGRASLSLESGQRSLPLSLPLPCFCAAVFFHALDYCLLLSGKGCCGVELARKAFVVFSSRQFR